MLTWIVISAILCASPIRGQFSISFFYPLNTNAASCTGSVSWTKWFNSAKPGDNGGIDRELLQVIQLNNGLDICPRPSAIQAQSVGELNTNGPFGGSWFLTNNVISGFQSTTSGIDYQVRFCCPNTDFTPATTTTTTPRPITNSTCGRADIQHSLGSSRISGGSAATPNSWPWQVLYEERKPCGLNRICLGICGGTLIDSRHVLTAAHCIGTTDPSSITITAGLHNRLVNEPDTRQVKTVESIFMHPGWNRQTLENDLTILRLSQPVEFNTYVQPACLPGPDPQVDADVVLIGWGATQIGGSAHHELKQAKVKVIGDCNRYWPQVQEEKQICVGHRQTGDSACQGDSGGPMLLENDGQWVVVGVTSFGSSAQCATFEASPPNVYARVAYYLPWILSII